MGRLSLERRSLIISSKRKRGVILGFLKTMVVLGENGLGWWTSIDTGRHWGAMVVARVTDDRIAQVKCILGVDVFWLGVDWVYSVRNRVRREKSQWVSGKPSRIPPWDSPAKGAQICCNVDGRASSTEQIHSQNLTGRKTRTS